ncbi:Receptor-type tyrosine-protein phosphatase zeta, partial [Geodia barretti]
MSTSMQVMWMVYSKPKKFIAAQGPVPSSIVDFWRMVWQEKVPSVVMITNLVEGKKTKCEQYWPSSGSQDFGPFHVSITHQLTLADYTIRTLSV